MEENKQAQAWIQLIVSGGCLVFAGYILFNQYIPLLKMLGLA